MEQISPNMIQAIDSYAARNNDLHNPINNLIADGNFPKIASTICEGWAELGNIVPADMCEEGQFMRAVPLEFRHGWLKMPFTWFPKPTLVAEWDAMKNAADKKRQAEQFSLRPLPK